MNKTQKTAQEILMNKVYGSQSNIPTFYDNYIKAAIEHEQGRLVELQFIELMKRERWAVFSERTSHSVMLSSEIIRSQGVREALSWRGMPLFKSIHDLAIFPMILWDVKPKTIIEIGSGTGSSALWMKDILRSFNLDTFIYSLDFRKVPVSDPSINFIQGDCQKIEVALPIQLLNSLPHPWVIIEDAHVNLKQVLRHLTASAIGGDYLIVEDSLGKQSDLQEFLAENPDRFLVDQKYVDYFGENATTAVNSIFKCVERERNESSD